MKNYFYLLLTSVMVLLLFSNVTEAQVTFSNGPLYVRVDSYGAIRFFTIQGTDTLQHINRISLLAAGNEG